jgi:hypothetical protein
LPLVVQAKLLRCPLTGNGGPGNNGVYSTSNVGNIIDYPNTPQELPGNTKIWYPVGGYAVPVTSFYLRNGTISGTSDWEFNNPISGNQWMRYTQVVPPGSGASTSFMVNGSATVTFPGAGPGNGSTPARETQIQTLSGVTATTIQYAVPSRGYLKIEW